MGPPPSLSRRREFGKNSRLLYFTMSTAASGLHVIIKVRCKTSPTKVRSRWQPSPGSSL